MFKRLSEALVRKSNRRTLFNIQQPGNLTRDLQILLVFIPRGLSGYKLTIETCGLLLNYIFYPLLPKHTFP